MYGSVRYMCEHRMDPYVLENTRRILRSLYVARTWPVRGPYGSRWWPWVHIRVLGPVRLPTCLLRGKKKMCMHNFQTRAAYGYKGSIRAEKSVELRAGPCGPVRYAVRSPTGHWNVGLYGARKLPGSPMWPRHNMGQFDTFVAVQVTDEGERD